MEGRGGDGGERSGGKGAEMRVNEKGRGREGVGGRVGSKSHSPFRMQPGQVNGFVINARENMNFW